MTYHNRSGEIRQGGQQGVAGLHIRMMGGFIKQEQIGRGDQKLCQHHPALFASGENADFF